MEIEVPSSSSSSNLRILSSVDIEKDKVRVKRKTLETVLEQCQRALESLNDIDLANDDDDDDEQQESNRGSTSVESPIDDHEADELCDLLKSRVDCADFLEKLETAQVSVPQNAEWDMISENDLWADGEDGSDQDDYVLVRQEDIVEGIACFMAAYLLSLKQTKDVTPNQLQEALSKTFSVKKKKGKLRKAWDGSKVIYNVASWGATAIGIYQNPVILRAATKAFWTSCHVISKLL